jgi:hypothetical protein
MLIQKKKIKNRREETKIDSEIEKKKTVKNDFWGLVIFFGRVFKQLYFFSGFNTGPVYHLRVVEQKLSFAQQNLCFVLNLLS